MGVGSVPPVLGAWQLCVGSVAGGTMGVWHGGVGA